MTFRSTHVSRFIAAEPAAAYADLAAVAADPETLRARVEGLSGTEP